MIICECKQKCPKNKKVYICIRMLTFMNWRIKMKTNVTIFSKRLKELRLEKNWSQEDFSKMLGISRASLVNYENGLRIPDIYLASNMASALEVTTDYLIGKSDKYIKNDELSAVAAKWGIDEGVIQLFCMKNYEEPYNLETLNMLFDPWDDYIISDLLLWLRKYSAYVAKSEIEKKKWLFMFMNSQNMKIQQEDLNLKSEEIEEKYIKTTKQKQEWAEQLSLCIKLNSSLNDDSFDGKQYCSFRISKDMILLADNIADKYINNKQLFIPEHFERFVNEYCNNEEKNFDCNDSNFNGSNEYIEDANFEENREDTKRNINSKLAKYGFFNDAIEGEMDMSSFVIEKSNV